MIQQNHPRVNCSSYKNPEMSHTCYSKDETSRGLQHVCANLSMIARLKTFHSKSECQKPFLKQQLHICAIYMYNMYTYIVYHNIYEISSRDNTHHFFFSIFTRCDHHHWINPTWGFSASEAAVEASVLQGFAWRPMAWATATKPCRHSILLIGLWASSDWLYFW